MIYRIVTSPPGYAPDERYMVAAYENLDLDSYLFGIAEDDGSIFFATSDDARRVIPKEATRLPFEPTDQFVEVWSGVAFEDTRRTIPKSQKWKWLK